MSLSNNHPHDPAKLSHLPVNPIRPVPALEKKWAEEEKKESAEISIEDATVPAEPSAEPVDKEKEQTAPVETQPEPTAPAKKKSNWQDMALDTLLVAMVVGVVGGGGYYLKKQRDLYRVPSAVEISHEQFEALSREREELQDKANHADEQLRMREKLRVLDDRLAQISAKSAELTDFITEQQNRVLALQHEIRRADKDARKVARGLLPGFYVGDVSTTRGKSYTGATISRYENKRLSIRTSYGAASFPVNELVKDTLPEIVQYALNFIDLVDMSDFTTNGAAPTTPKGNAAGRTTAQTPRTTSREVNYEPGSKGPVVDTQANKAEDPDDGLLPQP